MAATFAYNPLSDYSEREAALQSALTKLGKDAVCAQLMEMISVDKRANMGQPLKGGDLLEFLYNQKYDPSKNKDYLIYGDIEWVHAYCALMH